MAATEKALKVVDEKLPAETPVDDWSEHAGKGLEGTTQESFSVPFLTVLQKGSPQVDETSGVAIDGAKAGMLFETVSGRLYDGKKGVLFLPCATRQVYLRWRPRGVEGAGFRGEFAPEAVAAMRASGEVVDVESRLFFPSDDGSVNEKRNDRLADTRNHYILIIDEENGNWTPALMSLTSTQIKKSKNLNAMLQGRKLTDKNGRLFTPPTFANIVRVTTVPESNDMGSWFGVSFKLEGTIPSNRPEWKMAAIEFNKSVVEGQAVAAKYDDHAMHPEKSGGGAAEFKDDDIPFANPYRGKFGLAI
jgi:hypothetical protein